MSHLNPEQRARQRIDAQLIACGWVVQDYRAVDFSAGRGIALREAPLKSGTCDDLLLVDRKAVGVIEAKKESTGVETFSRDERDPSPRSRRVFTSLSIELEDLELSPFNQRGGLGKAHQLLGAQLPALPDELNEALAA